VGAENVKGVTMSDDENVNFITMRLAGVVKDSGTSI